MEGTFCFIDMAGFTALTEAHGDETAANLVERFISIVTTVAAGTGSRLVGFFKSCSPGRQASPISRRCAQVSITARRWNEAETISAHP
jgi:class 3 adenylate cyclase